MLIRIHFTERDLKRIRFASTPDPLWETLLGMHIIMSPRSLTSPVFTSWRDRALRTLEEHKIVDRLRMLSALAPPDSSYFPDFLTPAASSEGLTSGLVSLLRTPKRQLTTELAIAGTRHHLPSWAKQLAHGERETLAALADSLRYVHDAVIAPDWSEVGATVGADWAVRTRARDAGGTTAVLESLSPLFRWNPPVLEAPYPVRHDIFLNGRGLLMIPSFFCWQKPVALRDLDLGPTLVYPVQHRPSWAPRRVRDEHASALGAVLGRTRTRVLTSLRGGATTTELAKQLGISYASASEHVSVLREASLARSTRTGTTVLHTLTPLGEALLHNKL